MKSQKYIKNFYSNILIFISSIALVLLFSSPSKFFIPIGIIFGGLITGFLALNGNLMKEIKGFNYFIKIYSLVSSIISSFSVGHCFYSTYYNNDVKVFTGEITMIISILLSILSLLSAYVLFNLLFSYLLSKQLDEKVNSKQNNLLKNLISNSFLWFCGFFYVLIQMSTFNLFYIWPSIAISVMFIGVFLSLKPRVLQSMKEFKLSIKLSGIVCAFGACIFPSDIFKEVCYRYFTYYVNIPIITDVTIFTKVFSFFVFLFSVIYLSVVVSYFYDMISPVIKKSIKGISRIEYIIAVFVGILFLILASYVYTQSDIFYENDFRYDLIYTADSGEATNANVFTAINSLENDFRQGLFAVFSIPFTGIVSAVGYIFSFYIYAKFLFLEYSQVLMLIFTVLIFVNLFKISKIKRIFIFLFTVSVYPTLLFSLMIEQYVMAVFWLMLYVSLYINYNEDSEISYLGSVGSLTTSGIIRFLSIDTFSLTNIKNRFFSVIKSLTAYLVICFTFSRLQFIELLSKNMNDFKEFSGSGVGLLQKLMQYVNFVGSCFVSPAGGPKVSDLNAPHYTWAMNQVTSFNILGIIVIIISIISFVLNKKDKLTKLSFYWVCFSFVLLFLMGWGTSENGLVLYTLYFSWAFIVLIVNLLEYIAEKIKFKYLTSVALGAFSVGLLIFNIIELLKIIDFAMIWRTMTVA